MAFWHNHCHIKKRCEIQTVNSASSIVAAEVSKPNL